MNTLASRILRSAEGDLQPVLIHTFGLMLLLGIFFAGLLYGTQGYILDEENFTIVRPADNKLIKLTDIEDARVLTTEEMSGIKRTFGNIGLFGYIGLYYNSKIGKMTFYTTRRNNRILILTKKGRKIVITPDDLSMIDKFKEVLTSNKTQAV